MGAHTAVEDIKRSLGDTAGLVVVPYFKLPHYGEPFDDTEGRFPQLKEFKEFLDQSDDTGCTYWFAQVLPKKEGERDEYLAINRYDGLRLIRRFSTDSIRYIGTLVIQNDTN